MAKKKQEVEVLEEIIEDTAKVVVSTDVEDAPDAVEMPAVDSAVEEETAEAEDVADEVVSEETAVAEEVTDDAAAVDETMDTDDEAGSEEVAEDPYAGKGDWYIIQTYSGHEYKVKRSLEQRIAMLQLEDRIYEILIPEEEVVEVKNNEKIERQRKMYPGYIFVRMVFDDDLWYIMKKIPGLSKFMGHQQMPVPVRDEEMLKVLRQVGVKVQKFSVDFEIGDIVKIIAGPFRGYTGPVKEINMEKGKIRSTLLIFGRETPVEINFDQVEKAAD